jgi:hypothetical protein
LGFVRPVERLPVLDRPAIQTVAVDTRQQERFRTGEFMPHRDWGRRAFTNFLAETWASLGDDLPEASLADQIRRPQGYFVGDRLR